MDVAIFRFFPQKTQKYVLFKHWINTDGTIDHFNVLESSPEGALGTKKSKQTLRSKISLLLVWSQWAHRGPETQKKPKNSKFLVQDATILFCINQEQKISQKLTKFIKKWLFLRGFWVPLTLKCHGRIWNLKNRVP